MLEKPLEFYLERMVKKLQPLFQRTDPLIISPIMMRLWSPVSVEKDTPSEIFQVLDLKFVLLEVFLSRVSILEKQVLEDEEFS